jgi:hypothetical protein
VAVDGALARLRADALLVGDEVVQLTDTAMAVWRRPLGLGDPVATWLGHLTATDLKNPARNPGLKPAVRKADLLDQVGGFLQVGGILGDADSVRGVVAGAPADVRDLLDRAAAGGEVEPDAVYYTSPGPPRTPKVWAVARGLLMRTSDWGGPLVMPAEVALAIRGPAYTAPFEGREKNTDDQSHS